MSILDDSIKFMFIGKYDECACSMYKLAVCSKIGVGGSNRIYIESCKNSMCFSKWIWDARKKFKDRTRLVHSYQCKLYLVTYAQNIGYLLSYITANPIFKRKLHIVFMPDLVDWSVKTHLLRANTLELDISVAEQSAFSL